MAIKIGTGTGVKWAQLEPEKLPSAIKGRLRGGAQNPHGTTLSLSRRYLTKRATAEQVRKTIKAIPDPRKQELAERAFEMLLSMFPEPTWQPVDLPKSPSLFGPRRLLEIRTEPHVVLNDGRYLRHILLWPNLTPELHPSGARMAGLLMRELCKTQLGVINTFEVVDLLRGIPYAFEADELDLDRRALTLLINRLEEAVARLDE